MYLSKLQIVFLQISKYLSSWLIRFWTAGLPLQSASGLLTISQLSAQVKIVWTFLNCAFFYFLEPSITISHLSAPVKIFSTVQFLDTSPFSSTPTRGVKFPPSFPQHKPPAASYEIVLCLSASNPLLCTYYTSVTVHTVNTAHMPDPLCPQISCMRECYNNISCLESLVLHSSLQVWEAPVAKHEICTK